MDQQTLESTRRALHGIAEFVLAGPQYDESQDIRLRATPGGFGTMGEPTLRVDGPELVTVTGRLPLRGTFASLAAAAGLKVRLLRDVYATGPEVAPGDPIVVDAEAVGVIARAFANGDAAMRAFAPGEEPVLWPEHFDIGISLDEVNYGVSPGDAHLAEPYAYVGPWTQRTGAFWNMPFGATCPLSELPDAGSIERFFDKGRSHAATDPSRG